MRLNGLNYKVPKNLVDMTVGTTVKYILGGSSVKAILYCNTLPQI
jgi:hypothetical protein